MDINVRLGGGGGGKGRQAKLSAKETSKNNKYTVMGFVTKMGKSAIHGSEAFMSTTTNLLQVGMYYGMIKTAEKVLNVASQYREARSGESMLESNYRAKVKTAVNLGLNITYGEFKNTLFRQPQIVRQNMSINYERELYNYSIYSGKYKWR